MELAAITPRPAVNLVGYHGSYASPQHPHEGAGVPRHCDRPATTWATDGAPDTGEDGRPVFFPVRRASTPSA